MHSCVDPHNARGKGKKKNNPPPHFTPAIAVKYEPPMAASKGEFWGEKRKKEGGKKVFQFLSRTRAAAETFSPL